MKKILFSILLLPSFFLTLRASFALSVKIEIPDDIFSAPADSPISPFDQAFSRESLRAGKIFTNYGIRIAIPPQNGERQEQEDGSVLIENLSVDFSDPPSPSLRSGQHLIQLIGQGSLGRLKNHPEKLLLVFEKAVLSDPQELFISKSDLHDEQLEKKLKDFPESLPQGAQGDAKFEKAERVLFSNLKIVLDPSGVWHRLEADSVEYLSVRLLNRFPTEMGDMYYPALIRTIDRWALQKPLLDFGFQQDLNRPFWFSDSFSLSFESFEESKKEAKLIALNPLKDPLAKASIPSPFDFPIERVIKCVSFGPFRWVREAKPKDDRFEWRSKIDFEGGLIQESLQWTESFTHLQSFQMESSGVSKGPSKLEGDKILTQFFDGIFNGPPSDLSPFEHSQNLAMLLFSPFETQTKQFRLRWGGLSRNENNGRFSIGPTFWEQKMEQEGAMFKNQGTFFVDSIIFDLDSQRQARLEKVFRSFEGRSALSSSEAMLTRVVYPIRFPSLIFGRGFFRSQSKFDAYSRLALFTLAQLDDEGRDEWQVGSLQISNKKDASFLRRIEDLKFFFETDAKKIRLVFSSRDIGSSHYSTAQGSENQYRRPAVPESFAKSDPYLEESEIWNAEFSLNLDTAAFLKSLKLSTTPLAEDALAALQKMDSSKLSFDFTAQGVSAFADSAADHLSFKADFDAARLKEFLVAKPEKSQANLPARRQETWEGYQDRLLNYFMSSPDHLELNVSVQGWADRLIFGPDLFPWSNFSKEDWTGFDWANYGIDPQKNSIELSAKIEGGKMSLNGNADTKLNAAWKLHKIEEEKALNAIRTEMDALQKKQP